MSSKITDVARAGRVLAVRNAKGLTQQAIAKALGLSLRGYQTYERGECGISTDLTEALLRTFHVSPVWLLTGDGPMFLGEQEGHKCCDQAPQDRRIAALVGVLDQLANEDRDAILAAAFARAADKKQLAELRQAIADLRVMVAR